MEGTVPHRIEEIEKADCVWTCVRAIASPNAPVVHLRIESFSIVVAGVGRADGLTRRVITLLTENGLEFNFDIGKLSLVIAFDADPMQSSPHARLLFSDGGDIVLGTASDHTGFTACTAVEVYCHTPAMCHSIFLALLQLGGPFEKPSREHSQLCLPYF